MSSAGVRFACEECQRVFSCRGKLNQHQRVHSGQKPYACEEAECGRRFARKDNLRRHAMSHRPPHDRPLACSVAGCLKRFCTQQKLRHHEQRHSEPLPLACERCSARFAKRNVLLTHLMEHTGTVEHICPSNDCQRSFSKARDLSRHYKRQHSDWPRYQCGESGCSDAFCSFNDLAAHRRSAHSHLACEQCGRQFSRRARLHQHMRVHRQHLSDRLKYPCKQCGKRLSSPSNLRTHVRCVHEKRQSFACNICGRTFRLKQSMERHQYRLHESTSGDGDAHDLNGVCVTRSENVAAESWMMVPAKVGAGTAAVEVPDVLLSEIHPTACGRESVLPSQEPFDIDFDSVLHRTFPCDGSDVLGSIVGSVHLPVYR